MLGDAVAIIDIDLGVDFAIGEALTARERDGGSQGARRLGGSGSRADLSQQKQAA